jgi:hypothetical protein
LQKFPTLPLGDKLLDGAAGGSNRPSLAFVVAVTKIKNPLRSRPFQAREEMDVVGSTSHKDDDLLRR